MSKAQFSLAFEGPAIEDGSMSVNDLAPALLAVKDLFSDANKVLNGRETPVNLYVQASSQGSFEISLQLTQGFVETIMTLARQDHDAAALVDVVFGSDGTVGVIAMIRWLKGRKTEDVRRVETEDGDFVLQREDGERLPVPRAVLTAGTDTGVRRGISRAYVGVLDAEGIDSVTAKGDRGILLEVTKDEREYLREPELEGTTVTDDTREMAFTLSSPSFVRGNKWRLSDGASTIYASIEDEDFNRKVQTRSITFGMGDVLRCRTRVRQYVSDEGRLRVEYTVEKVLAHEIQTGLFDDDTAEPPPPKSE